MKKYICILCCFFLFIVSAFADSTQLLDSAEDMQKIILPVDATALDIAIENISDKASVKSFLYSAILEKTQITAMDIISMCYDMDIDQNEIKAFVFEYINILTNRTNCAKANNINVTWQGKTYSLNDCYRLEQSQESEGWHGETAVGQCKRLIDATNKCSIYLYHHYKDKLLEPDITKSEKKQYKCIIEKLETGEMEIPTTKMIKDCK